MHENKRRQSRYAKAPSVGQPYRVHNGHEAPSAAAALARQASTCANPALSLPKGAAFMPASLPLADRTDVAGMAGYGTVSSYRALRGSDRPSHGPVAPSLSRHSGLACPDAGQGSGNAVRRRQSTFFVPLTWGCGLRPQLEVPPAAATQGTNRIQLILLQTNWSGDRTRVEP